MTGYSAPLREMQFALEAVAGLADISKLPGLEDAQPDLIGAALDEANKLAESMIVPLQRVGDTQPPKIENGVVRTSPGWPAAYKQYVEGGWNAPAFDPEIGGGGLPWVATTAFNELFGSACLSFSLGPLLTQGAIDLLEAHGTDEQKTKYLEKMVSGEWTGTMNLTEPQAGSDVGALRAKATRDGDRFRIKGQKIYISYGDHDLTDNIVHMVLARIEGAPPGIRGVSLFVVPKFLVNEDGSLGDRNDLRPVSLEHKMGIHGSPTCVMSYGDNHGAIGWLVGQENGGIQSMFTMMNNARLGVGLQGLSVAERALQQATTFAAERKQGRDPETGEENAPISRHPDVQRMLATMRSETEGMRALCYWVAARMDESRRSSDPEVRAQSQRLLDLLIPVVKAYCTDRGVEVASTNIQVHGGMGFIEDTGAAQILRDSRIAPIYEGTNGIQALDLLGRKLVRDGGEAMSELIALIRDDLEIPEMEGFADLAVGVRAGVDALETASEAQLKRFGANPSAASAAAVDYLELVGRVVSAWLLTKGAASAKNWSGGDIKFTEARIAVARYFIARLLPPAIALTEILGPSADAALAVSVATSNT
jgi:alkylation response protein AidB-like acyl-CoA dehydrogenase